MSSITCSTTSFVSTSVLTSFFGEGGTVGDLGVACGGEGGSCGGCGGGGEGGACGGEGGDG